MDIPNWLYIPFYSVSIYPAGLLRMSAHSLSLHLRVFMNNGSTLLRPQSIAQMQTVVNGVIPYENVNKSNNESSLSALEFGLIWHWQRLDNGRRYLGHGGSMPGVLHSMLINEKGDLGMIILTNADIYPDNDISRKIGTTLNKIRLALFDCFET
jgi:CubicO group peptidase (beta-lactamase class C family)